MNHLKLTVPVHVKVRNMPRPQRKKGTNSDILRLQKVEDPIRRLVRQQEQAEAEVTSATKGRYAKQRDVGDSSYNYQGPQRYRGGNFGYGTKDRMPGTTPQNFDMNPLEYMLDALGIKKFIPTPPRLIKSKDTDLI